MAENEQGTNPPEDTAQPVEPVAAEPAAAGQGQVSKDAKTMALLCHLLAIFTGFLGPLILWLLKKEDDPFIDEHGKEALNFQITMLIAGFAGGLLMCVGIGIIVLIAVPIINLIFCIIATIKANSGELYRYPIAIRLVK
jgi:uncharacterized Tic20 family protein